ncbi:hypothetical protein ACFPM0_03280 [Pseudonocardia sulfidoxydans]|uniref:hypothetical protein n=1 Tax=Pseudonocardia sulfidoxydans TaxID=54011 RepID=UPI0036147E65
MRPPSVRTGGSHTGHDDASTRTIRDDGPRPVFPARHPGIARAVTLTSTATGRGDADPAP